MVSRSIQIGSQTTVLLEGHGSRRRLVEHLQSQGQRWLVISDERVSQHWRSDPFAAEVPWLLVPSGEEFKSIASASRLWSELCALKVDRHTAVVAVGGGMVCDLAGFVAATYLRGLPFCAVPTSLLAMVDASVGGKVAVDLPEGKNLVGQFYPAQAVALDSDFLDSLPVVEWSSGMAEVIKHGLIAGDPLWTWLESLERQDLLQREVRDRLLHEAVEVKRRIVEVDPFERLGPRATLNLGHTFGHALEWSSAYRLRHGEAVGLGLLAAVRMSRALGLLQQDLEPRLVALLERWGLPTQLPEPFAPSWEWSRLMSALDRDKKNRGGRWTFLLLRGPGRVETVVGPEPDQVRSAFDSLRSPARAGAA